jgi:hypothetical protein
MLGKAARPSKPCAWFVAGWCVVAGGVHSAAPDASIRLHLEDRVAVAELRRRRH